jgi:hypothetical protein
MSSDALARSWTARLEAAPGGGLVPQFQADVMEAIMAGVSEPCWPRWHSVRAPATAVFAATGMFSAGGQAAFIGARPGTGTGYWPAARMTRTWTTPRSGPPHCAACWTPKPNREARQKSCRSAQVSRNAPMRARSLGHPIAPR